MARVLRGSPRRPEVRPALAGREAEARTEALKGQNAGSLWLHLDGPKNAASGHAPQDLPRLCGPPP